MVTRNRTHLKKLIVESKFKPSFFSSLNIQLYNNILVKVLFDELDIIAVKLVLIKS